jgi:hypothetical protein
LVFRALEFVQAFPVVLQVLRDKELHRYLACPRLPTNGGIPLLSSPTALMKIALDASFAPLAAQVFENMMVRGARRKASVYSKMIRSPEERIEHLLGDCPLYRRFGNISKGVHPQQHLL